MRGFVVLLAALASLCTGLVPAASGAATSPGTAQHAASSDSGEGSRAEARAVRHFRGQAFDTCKAPSFQTMRAWRQSSPFRGVGIYFGGRARHCPNQENLTPSWVRGVDRMGWRMLPIYVGSQSPCVTSQHKRKTLISSRHPVMQGVQEGRDAVRRASALGLGRSSALYLDMEMYRWWEHPRCAVTTRHFIQAWNYAVRKNGYVPGLYSSSNAGIKHMARARAEGHGSLPHAVWFARWTKKPQVDREPVLPPGSWYPHRRVHQFEGNTTKTYGGQKIQIDRNAVDAPVAAVP
ncbi:DUF1906 domain-containing protein [Streptomyces sp. ODS28]|uniref:DUF1906 domain-containing protein n=1 Tax=Streptomyces sp. ODS28 TaxID=3136688 RepID=UPI0031E78363